MTQGPTCTRPRECCLDYSVHTIRLALGDSCIGRRPARVVTASSAKQFPKQMWPRYCSPQPRLRSYRPDAPDDDCGLDGRCERRTRKVTSRTGHKRQLARPAGKTSKVPRTAITFDKGCGQKTYRYRNVYYFNEVKECHVISSDSCVREKLEACFGRNQQFPVFRHV